MPPESHRIRRSSYGFEPGHGLDFLHESLGEIETMRVCAGTD